MWRLQTTDRTVVLRVSPVERKIEDLARAYAAAAALAARLPEVTPPVPTIDDQLVTTWDDRPVSVWSYAEGVPLDRRIPALRTSAAGLLARLHRAGLQVAAGLGYQPAPGQGLVHGDFYGRNLLCHRGRVTGLVDWDEVRVQRLDAELAWATWELNKSAERDTLADDRAAGFVADYRAAGGPATPGADFLAHIRARLTGELGGSDPAYVASLARALPTLADDQRPKLLAELAQPSPSGASVKWC